MKCHHSQGPATAACSIARDSKRLIDNPLNRRSWFEVQGLEDSWPFIKNPISPIIEVLSNYSWGRLVSIVLIRYVVPAGT